MDKIAIIGSSGAGKTTLAKKLDSRLGMKAYHLDRFFWQPNWRKKSKETRIDILQNLASQRCWIIEGSYLNSSELHLIAADTIIFLDTSPFVCFWRRIKRHRKYQGHPGRDLPMGSADKLTFSCILKILFFPFKERRDLEDKLRKVASSKKIIRLHSTKEVERFLEQPETYINESAPSISSVGTFLILAFVLIAFLTNIELAFAISIGLAALGLILTTRPIQYFSPLNKEHQTPVNISKSL